MVGFDSSPACFSSVLPFKRVRLRGSARRNSARAFGVRKANPRTHTAKAIILSMTGLLDESVSVPFYSCRWESSPGNLSSKEIVKTHSLPRSVVKFHEELGGQGVS